MLQAHHQQTGGGLRFVGCLGVPLFAGGAVLIEQAGKLKLRRVRRQAINGQPLDVAVREPALDLADVVLQAAHHHVFQVALAAHLDAPGEAVGVQQFQRRVWKKAAK